MKPFSTRCTPPAEKLYMQYFYYTTSWKQSSFFNYPVNFYCIVLLYFLPQLIIFSAGCEISNQVSHQFRQRQVRSFWWWAIAGYAYCQNTIADGAAWADLWWALCKVWRVCLYVSLIMDKRTQQNWHKAHEKFGLRHMQAIILLLLHLLNLANYCIISQYLLTPSSYA